MRKSNELIISLTSAPLPAPRIEQIDSIITNPKRKIKLGFGSMLSNDETVKTLWAIQFLSPSGILNRLEELGSRRRFGAEGTRARHGSERDAAFARTAEVEYKCGMFMVLPFYFIRVAAKH